MIVPIEEDERTAAIIQQIEVLTQLALSPPMQTTGVRLEISLSWRRDVVDATYKGIMNSLEALREELTALGAQVDVQTELLDSDQIPFRADMLNDDPDQL